MKNRKVEGFTFAAAAADRAKRARFQRVAAERQATLDRKVDGIIARLDAGEDLTIQIAWPVPADCNVWDGDEPTQFLMADIDPNGTQEIVNAVLARLKGNAAYMTLSGPGMARFFKVGHPLRKFTHQFNMVVTAIDLADAKKIYPAKVLAKYFGRELIAESAPALQAKVA